MKTKLLKKCRKRFIILNNYGTVADKNDKKVTVWKMGGLAPERLKNSKGGTQYINYGNAVIKRRNAILEYAWSQTNHYELKIKKPWYKCIFQK